MDTLQAPAALVAAGLLDAPGDPEGWDQPGSLGEIVALLRKLLVLLNVYSFGAPNLPENKTQYLLVGKRNTPAPLEAIRAPAAAPTRIMTLVRPSSKTASADQWLRPRSLLTRRARDHGFVFDRPPLMLSPGSQRYFLFEGGKPRDGVSPNPIGFLERGMDWLSDKVTPAEAREKAKASAKSLRKSLEKKQDTKAKDGSHEKFDVSFIGQYQTWCPEPTSGNTCWCCEEAHVDRQLEESGLGLWPLIQFLVASLIALMVLAMILVPTYCTLTGACSWFGGAPPPPTFEPRVEATEPVQPQQAPVQAPAQIEAPAATTKPTYPGLDTTKPTPMAVEKEPVVTAPPTPKVEAPKAAPVFHVAFDEAKANLSTKAMDDISTAARTALANGVVNIRVVSLGAREHDVPLWQQRFRAVRDELVRLGVPANRIRDQRGPGPYLITIRPNQPMRPATTRRRISQDLDSVPDPMSGSF
jgi:outer membrane protein OmpA-like peptidoglycan-associated protein